MPEHVLMSEIEIITDGGRRRRWSGYPKTIRVDQGSEFISRDMDLWAYQRKLQVNPVG